MVNRSSKMADQVSQELLNQQGTIGDMEEESNQRYQEFKRQCASTEEKFKEFARLSALIQANHDKCQEMINQNNAQFVQFEEHQVWLKEQDRQEEQERQNSQQFLLFHEQNRFNYDQEERLRLNSERFLSFHENARIQLQEEQNETDENPIVLSAEDARRRRRRIGEANRRLAENTEQREQRLSNVRTNTNERRAGESGSATISRREGDQQRSADRRERERDAAIAIRKQQTFFTNSSLPLKERNPYYPHPLFKPSRNDFDHDKAEVSLLHFLLSSTSQLSHSSYQSLLFLSQKSLLFAYRRHKKYQSLEMHWSKCCGACGAQYLNTASKSFTEKCCGFDGHQRVPNLSPFMTKLEEIVNAQPELITKSATYYKNVQNNNNHHHNNNNNSITEGCRCHWMHPVFRGGMYPSPAASLI